MKDGRAVERANLVCFRFAANMADHGTVVLAGTFENCTTAPGGGATAPVMAVARLQAWTLKPAIRD